MSSDDQQAPAGSPIFNDLVERLEAKEEEARAEAVEAVGQLSPEMAMEGAAVLIPPLVAALGRRRNFGDEVCVQGLQAISTMGSAAVPHLTDQLEGGSYFATQIASAALARSGDSEGGARGRELLARFLFPEPPEEYDEWRARHAVAALKLIGDDEAVDFLANQVLGSHPNEFVRSQAAWALGNIANSRAAAALRRALDDPSTANVQPGARWALDKLEEVEPGSSLAEPPTPLPEMGVGRETGESKNEGPTQGGFFSRLFGRSGGGRESREKTKRQIKKMLAEAGPTTLRGCKQILSVTILHEKPVPPGYSGQKIAGLFVEQYKKSGWIPTDLSLGDDTPVVAIRRENVASLQTSERNAILADLMARVAKGKGVEGCAAITFSGDNPALGPTFFSVLAK